MKHINASKWFTVVLIVMFICVLSACSGSNNTADKQTQQKEKTTSEQTSADNTQKQQQKMKDNISLKKTEGHIGDTIQFTIDELNPNATYQLKWTAYDGHYNIKNRYKFIGPAYTQKLITLKAGESNNDGVWKGSFKVPDGFGGYHTLYVTQKDNKIGQSVFFVNPTFSIHPKSGPVGTMITLKAKGLGYRTYKSMWNLTYDNKHTGVVTAVSTNGTAIAKFRAAGSPGLHYISLRSGYLGSGYINYSQSPHHRWPAPNFTFKVTNEPPIKKTRVGKIPEPANGGVNMPDLQNKQGIQVSLSKTSGTVGEPVTLTASGLPENTKMTIVWNTMRGSRVTKAGFGEKSIPLDTVKTNDKGELTYAFKIPDDLGGLPHRIDIKANGDIYGQTYLRILPSIAKIYPKSGPVGTKIHVVIKGGGWTEFDNAYYMTYDNAFMGYMCSFNSEGTLKFTVTATGDPGYHIIDLYPGVYKQQEKTIDMTLNPQLTYVNDHPGSGMPAIRFGFTITED